MGHIHAAHVIVISTHAPAGGATRTNTGRKEKVRVISTHAPAGGATEPSHACHGAERFLLTPLREGRLIFLQNRAKWDVISTHAPAGGATVQGGVIGEFICISTHAPAGGATTLRRRNKSGQTFLLTPLREGRPPLRYLCHQFHQFLLTPLREGRPLVMQWELQLSSYFYSRPCGRGDIASAQIDEIRVLFLLTPLREGRQQFSTSPS